MEDEERVCAFPRSLLCLNEREASGML
jgi:hypothetical protein